MPEGTGEAVPVFEPLAGSMTEVFELPKAGYVSQVPADLDRSILPPFRISAWQDEFQQETSAQPASEEDQVEGEEDVAWKLLNPVADLWSLNFQNDYTRWDGDLLDFFNEDATYMNSFKFQPVMSFALSTEWRAIIRPIISLNTFDAPEGFDVVKGIEEKPIITLDMNRTTGMGDTVLWTAFSNQYDPPVITGFGPTAMIPTANDDLLGTGKWAAGPMGLAFYLGEKWVFGVIGQHWWSFEESDSRDSVNLTDVQTVYRYRLTPTMNIGAGPNIQYNWNADGGEKLRLPIGLGVDNVFKIGKLPVKLGLEFHYYLEQPDAFGPEWNLRFVFTPVIPAPGFSKKPVF